MSIYTAYRISIWLPILIPGALVIWAAAFGVRLPAGPLVGELLAYSLFYGGLPYTALAIWATWWVGGRSEADIRRLMFRAPVLMAAWFGVLALLLGVAVGSPRLFVVVAVLGSLIILPLGYAYVGLAVLLRRVLGTRGAAGVV